MIRSIKKDIEKAEEILKRIQAIEKKISEEYSLDTLNEYFSTDTLKWGVEGSNLSHWKALKLRSEKNIPLRISEEGQSGYWHGQFNYHYTFASLPEILEITDAELDELEKAVEEAVNKTA